MNFYRIGHWIFLFDSLVHLTMGDYPQAIFALCFSILQWLIWKEKQIQKESKNLIVIKVDPDGKIIKTVINGREVQLERVD